VKRTVKIHHDTTLFEFAEQAPKAHARHRDPETSKEAAREVDVTEGQWQVLNCLRALPRGVTDEELYRMMRQAGIKISPSGVRSRRSELVELALVKFAGRFEKTESGRNARVWEAIKP
jgi:Fe2+ or Zn2+ uptake regulation protein